MICQVKADTDVSVNQTEYFRKNFPLCQIKMDITNIDKAFAFFEEQTKKVNQMIISLVDSPDWHNEKFVFKIHKVNDWVSLNQTQQNCTEFVIATQKDSNKLLAVLKDKKRITKTEAAILLSVSKENGTIKFAGSKLNAPAKNGVMAMPSTPVFVAIDSKEVINFLDYSSYPSELKADTYFGCMYDHTKLYDNLLNAYKRKIADKKLELYTLISKIKEKNENVVGSEDCLRVELKPFHDDISEPDIPIYLTPSNKNNVYQIVKTLSDNMIHFVALLQMLKQKRWDIDLIPSNFIEFVKYIFSGEAEELLIIILCNVLYLVMMITCCCYFVGKRRRRQHADQTLRALRRIGD